MISVSIFACQSGATVNMLVSSWVRTDGKQAATGVSQNNRSHVRSPEAADARSEAFFDIVKMPQRKHIQQHRPAGAVRKPMTRVYRELSVNIPPPRSKERGVSHVSCRLIKKCVMVWTCRLTMNQKLEEQHGIKLKGEVGGACKQR